MVYNDKSVLENMHASKGLELLMGTRTAPDRDILRGFSNDQASMIRQRIIQAVLQTDMTHHFEKVNHVKGLVMEAQEEQTVTKHNDDNKTGKDTEGTSNSTSSSSSCHLKGESILGFLLHAADISNGGKPAPVFAQWTDRCLEEFFQQGDKGRELGLPLSPLCDRQTTHRAESQIGFITYIILPTFELLGKILPDVATHIVPIIHNNLTYWREQKTLERDEPTTLLANKASVKDENGGPTEGEGPPRKKTKK